MAISSLRGSTLPNKSFTAGRAKTRNVVTIAPDTATTFANGAAVSAGGGGGGGPTISNVSVTDSGYILSNTTPYIDSTGGYIKITGTGFASGCTVYVGGNAATSTTFISSTEVRAQVGAASSNAQSVYVVNTDSSVGIKLNAITYSGTPSWSTSASLDTQISDIAFSIPLSATSDSSIVYTLASGSSTPSGTTLYSNGVFAGTITGITSDTNYSFTVVATDIENQLSARAFTVTVSSGDQYFYTTSLLLNGEANVWIRDSSTNNFLPTIAGDTKPTAFSPYNTNWSAYFDGTNDYLACTYNTTFGTGNFTVECWVYMPSITNTYSSAIIGTTYYDGLTKGWSLEISSSGYPMFTLYNTSGTGVTTTGTTLLPANRWTHLAAVRSGTTITIYMNGASIISGTNATTDNFSNSVYIATNSTSFAIGVSSYSYAGYISNARVVVGIAVYTGNFTPPTTALTATQSSGTNIAAITGTSTSLLTLQDNRFKDNSSNAFAITKTGDIVIKSFGPITETDLTTGSGYFDGSGDYLSIADNANLQFSNTTVFTIEAWIYPLELGAQKGIIVKRGASATQEWGLLTNSSGYVMYGGNSQNLIGTTPLKLNAWNHIAASSDGTTVSIYSNGIREGTALATTLSIPTSTNAVLIGAQTTASNPFWGYITDARVIKGTQLYSGSTYTIPTSSLTAVANTQLLTLQYRRGDNNHRFIDESGNKYLVTRTGQVSQGSFSPFSPAGWSAYFDGTGDYLSIASNAAFAFGTGDFSIEFWAFPTSFATRQFFYDGITSDPSATIQISTDSSNLLILYVNGSIRIQQASGAMSLNTWNHVAVSRASGSTRMFLNGTQVGLTYSDTNSYITAPLIVMHNYNLSGGSIGYISTLRVVKGAGVYTGNFTVPTTTLSTTQSSGSNIAAITAGQTVLLTCNSNRFVDSSTSPLTITKSGDAKIQAFSPFRPSAAYTPTLHGGSAYFDGSGDYLDYSGSTNLAFGTGDWTIEFWVYFISVSGDVIIYDSRPASTNGAYPTIYKHTDNSFRYYTNSGERIASTTTVTANTWFHVAVARVSGSTRMFVNGIVQSTVYADSTTYLNGASRPRIGDSGVTVGAAINAHVSGLRVVTGQGIFTGNFTVPTAPPGLTQTLSTNVAAMSGNVTLLTNFTNAGIYDASARHVFETLADTKIANVQSKFGTGAMYFDGTGDYLTARNSPAHSFGTGDFTIECWMYCTDASTYRGLMGQGDNSTQGWGLYFNPNPTPLIIFIYGGSISYGSGVVAIGSWCHVAVTRYGTGTNNLKFYVNGSLVTNTTVTNNLSSTSPTYIGATAGGSYPFMGYLDEVRITAGYARYTGASLTVPTQTFLTK